MLGTCYTINHTKIKNITVYSKNNKNIRYNKNFIISINRKYKLFNAVFTKNSQHGKFTNIHAWIVEK